MRSEREGQVVGNKYRIGHLIGRGAMGEVFAAVTESGERAAVKFLRREYSRDPQLVARFQRETKIAVRLRSPNIASARAAGRDRNDDLWIAFELLQGESLQARWERSQPLPMTEVAWIIEDILVGLVAAHAAHVIHRDIKPANVFLARDGSPAPRPVAKILDFGISKLRPPQTTTDAVVTEVDETLGTISFMPPEQAVGSANVDARADIYSVGVVAYLLLTGVMPFVGTSSASILSFKLRHPPLTLVDGTHVSGWPQATEALLARLMAPDARDRPPSAAASVDAWRQVTSLAHPRLPIAR